MFHLIGGTFMLKLQKKYSKLFYKYLVSYFIILLLPLFVMFNIVNNQFVDILRDEIMINDTNTLNQIRNNIDDKIIQLEKISLLISKNYFLTPYNITNNSFNAMLGIKQLKDYCITHSLLDEIVLYINGKQVLYGSSSTYNISTFTEYIYKYQDIDKEKLYYILNNITNPIIAPMKGVLECNNTIKDIDIFVLPVPLDSPKPYGCVMFLMNDKKIKDIMKYDLYDNNENILILDKEGNIISSLNENTSIYNFKSIVDCSDVNGIIEANYNKSDFLLSYTKSPYTGLVYIKTTPVTKILEKIYYIKKLLFFAYISIFFAGVIIIYAAMRINYYPIKDLKQYAEEKIATPINEKNELEGIKNIIDNMYQQNVQLYNEMDNNKIAQKEYLLLNLLNGNVKDMDTFGKKSKDLGLDLSHPFYNVIIFSLNSNSIYMEQRNKIVHDVELSFQNYKINCYGITTIRDYIVFILSSDNSNIPSLDILLAAIQHDINTKYELTCTIGVGNMCSNISYIGKSYLEACTAIDYKLVKGIDKIIFFYEISQLNINNFEYPFDELDALEKSIKIGDPDILEYNLLKLLKYLKRSDMPLFIAKCLCYDIINTLFKTMFELNINIFNTETQYPDIITLSQFESTEELTNLIMRISFDICSSIRSTKESHNSKLRNALLVYIENNYTDYNFSVQNMAQFFDINQSYASRFFKDQTGMTITDYVTDLRINKAKELLTATTLSLSIIVNEIGYSDVSSFIKKFKEKEGITPGKYRKMHKQV